MMLKKIACMVVAALAMAVSASRSEVRAEDPTGVGIQKIANHSQDIANQSTAIASPVAGVPSVVKKESVSQTPGEEGIIHGEKPNYPRVLFVTTKDSPHCDEELARLRRAGGDFEKMRTEGWTIGETADNNVQIVDRDRIPELARKLNIKEYPAVACIDKGKIVRSFKSGCTTPLDAWTFGWLAKGLDERPTAPVLEAARVESTGSYPLRGNHWSVAGDWNPSRDAVVQHLRGPNHASEILATWKIEDWSYEELRSLHDDLHEREPGYNPYASSTPQSGVYKSKGEVR